MLFPAERRVWPAYRYTLQDIVVIELDTGRLEIYRRDASGVETWLGYADDAPMPVRLAGINAAVNGDRTKYPHAR